MNIAAGKRIFPTLDKELISFPAGTCRYFDYLAIIKSLTVLTALKYLEASLLFNPNAK
jgi:hypothetical protein